jgi:hypothetical protein
LILTSERKRKNRETREFRMLARGKSKFWNNFINSKLDKEQKKPRKRFRDWKFWKC